MEASSMIMMNASSSTCCLKKPTCSSMMDRSRRNSLKMGGFCEKGELEYYKSSIRCGGGEKRKVKVEEKKKKKKKKGEKLLNGLSRDLSVFYGMGFGLDSEYYQQKHIDDVGVADQVKFKMMSGAAELLLEKLKQVKKEDKELKKMKMEEKKKRKAEMKSTASVSCVEASSESSSSSESSDSESDNEMVVDLNRLERGLQLPQASVCTLPEVPVIMPSIPALLEDGNVSLLPATTAAVGEFVISGLGIRGNQEKNRVEPELGGMVGKKIEVCMGGKCKKSGAATLIEEFQKVVGFNDDIVVSGCKCMGKCKNGPNARVVNNPSSEAASPSPGNSLCLGVSVEDVGLIVSNFFGDESHQNGILGIPAAAAAAELKVLC